MQSYTVQASKYLKIGTCPASQKLLAYMRQNLIFTNTNGRVLFSSPDSATGLILVWAFIIFHTLWVQAVETAEMDVQASLYINHDISTYISWAGSYVVGTHWKCLVETLPMITTTNVLITNLKKYVLIFWWINVSYLGLWQSWFFQPNPDNIPTKLSECQW